MTRTLEQVLQSAYDSEISVTITWLWNSGFDVAIASYMEWDKIGRPIDQSRAVSLVEIEAISGPWRNVAKATDLAAEIDRMILEQFPQSKYARERRVN